MSKGGPHAFEHSDVGIDRTTLKWHDLGAHAGTVQLLDGEEVILNQSPSKYPKVSRLNFEYTFFFPPTTIMRGTRRAQLCSGDAQWQEI